MGHFPSAARLWWTACRAFRPDVLNVQCFGPNGLYADALARLTRTPLMVSSHGESFADDHAVFERSVLLRDGLRRAVSRASIVTGCSQVVVDDLQRRFGLEGGLVVPNGVTVSDSPPPRAPVDPPEVFALGRVEHTKGFDLLLEAFGTVAGRTNARLVIGGDGQELPALRRRARSLGLEERVHFPGRLTRAEVDAHLARSTVVAVPSRHEAFGLVVLEAWQGGIPVVATDRGGPGLLITDGVDGLVADPEDRETFGAALTKVIEDPDLADRLAAAGRVAAQRFEWDSVVELYEQCYAQLARTTGPTGHRP